MWAQTSRGFTLIELLVAMVIIGILAAVAIPNYSDYVRRNHRATAQAFLSDVADRQQQFLLNRRAYGTLADLGVTVPAEVSNFYTITVTTNATPGFTAAAAPTTRQSGDACGTLSIDQTGARTASTGAARCW